MIASLRGTILKKEINRLIVDVSGVGYEVAVSLNTMESLPGEGDVFLHIYTVLRENSLELYGFHDNEEKSLFELLISVSGIGPRTSLSILSGVSPTNFRDAVVNGDVHRLTRIPGIGKKSAERILVELKDKMKKLGLQRASDTGVSTPSTLEEDVISSLVNLGYKERLAEATVKKVLHNAKQEITPAEAVKLALKELMK
ncbi:MAG: holliday junction helicase RuvA [Thermodesulfobacteriota bacterium]|nr:holliday junction helicase RuvA [Thermodesulfobacteriota bacterium]